MYNKRWPFWKHYWAWLAVCQKKQLLVGVERSEWSVGCKQMQPLNNVAPRTHKVLWYLIAWTNTTSHVHYSTTYSYLGINYWHQCHLTFLAELSNCVWLSRWSSTRIWTIIVAGHALGITLRYKYNSSHINERVTTPVPPQSSINQILP